MNGDQDDPTPRAADPAAALGALEAAEPLLADVEADNARLAEAYAVLVAAVDRARPLSDYYGSDWLAHVDTVVTSLDDPAAVTPRAANQDAIWEALAEHDEWVRRILRLAADAVTRDVASG
ncbi:MAG TPA: hypothetical protein PLL54_09285 [Dermatophilaceae bacterium]|jgi:hypothetical protein|nr:hypothetical protein [Dermatophilaceae bacterium]